MAKTKNSTFVADPCAGLQKYAQTKEALESCLTGTPGEPVPSVYDIAEKLKLSPPTVYKYKGILNSETGENYLVREELRYLDKPKDDKKPEPTKKDGKPDKSK